MSAQAPPKRSLGRYDFGGDAWRPADLGRPPASANVQVSVVAVPDPYTPDRRVIAHVNRRVDILELERSRRAISEGAYRTGRELQHVLEARNRLGAASLDATSTITGEQKAGAMHGRLAHVIDTSAGYLDFVRTIVGLADAALLARILGERKNYRDCAALWGRGGDRGGRYIAGRFRDALEALAESRAARGKASAGIAAWQSEG